MIGENDINFQLGKQCFENKEYDLAIGYFNIVLAKDIMCYDAWFLKAQALKNLGDDENAEICFEIASKIKSNEVEGIQAKVKEQLSIKKSVDESVPDKYKYRVTFDIPVIVMKEGDKPERYWYFTNQDKAMKFMKKKCRKFKGMTGILEKRLTYTWLQIDTYRLSRPLPKRETKTITIKNGNVIRTVMKESYTLKAEPVIINKKIKRLMGPKFPP